MTLKDTSSKLDNESIVKTISDKKAYYESTDEESFATDSYDECMEWTDEEEQKVRNKLDIRLMSFILLTTFVLNMDRTNICKSKEYYSYVRRAKNSNI
jgi:hypothetical protein